MIGLLPIGLAFADASAAEWFSDFCTFNWPESKLCRRLIAGGFSGSGGGLAVGRSLLVD